MTKLVLDCNEMFVHFQLGNEDEDVFFFFQSSKWSRDQLQLYFGASLTAWIAPVSTTFLTVYLLVMTPRALVQTCQAPSVAEVMAALRQQSCHSATRVSTGGLGVLPSLGANFHTHRLAAGERENGKTRLEWKGSENACVCQGNAALFIFSKDRCTCISFRRKGLNSPLLYFGRAIKVDDSAGTVAHCVVSVSGWIIDRAWRTE